VPVSVTVAQAILESGWGAHHIGTANNYFGIKAQARNGQVTWGSIATGFVTVPTREVVNGQSVTVQANFRSYNSMTDSFRDHGSFLRNNSNYAAAFRTTDGIAFARAVAAGHYATDPHYADAVVKIIQQQNLLPYDSAAGDAGTPQNAGASDEGTGHAGTDAGTDASTDAGTDAGTDASTDAGTDAGTDASTDAGTDAGTDAETDTGSDAETDTATDTDTNTDAETDTGADAGSDAGTDAGADTATDENG